MIGNEIEDYQQLKAVKKKLSQNLSKKLLLKSLYHCGSKVPPQQKGVVVVANNKTAKFLYNASCKSPWCCPVCTGRKMAKYAADIGVAIDALKERNEYAAMITFTIPHTSGFSCEQSTEILYNVWKAFTVHGNKILESSKNDIFANFMATCKSKHRVRVTEYTWGSAGWHPHFHCLFWFPKECFNDIVQWEERLEKRWLELCERYTIKQLLIGYPETQRKTAKALVTTRVKIMYSKLNTCSHAVYISKKDGLPIIQESSNYICGWGGNREITGNVSYKASHEGHYTWQEILQNAINEDKALDAAQVPAEEDNKWWKLYFEYARATIIKRHARINYSVHSGLKKIIEEYKKTNAYKIVAKKNNMSLIEKFGKWRVVAWFNQQQWYAICNNDLEVDILKFAVDGGLTEINRLLAEHDIPPAVQKVEAENEKIEAMLNVA